MSKIIHNRTITKDWFEEIKNSDGAITVSLKLNDIEVGNYILFEEIIYFLFVSKKTSRNILTKVLKTTPIPELSCSENDIYWIQVENLQE